MSRDSKVHLEDILQAINKILKYTANMEQADFERDEKTLDAVIKNLEVIGEAVKNLPAKIRSKYPDVEWKKIAGLRDILIHEYFGVDIEILWDIVRNKLPILEKQARKILSDL